MNFLDRVKSGASSLWPFGRSASMPTDNTMDSATNFGTPFLLSSIFINSPTWYDFKGFNNLYNRFCRNPVLYSVIMIKARAFGNMKIHVRNKKTLEVEPPSTNKSIPSMLYKLIKKPNVLNSTWEFLQQRKIFEQLYGNSFTYGNFGIGLKNDITTLTSLWNVWPQHMKVKLTGKYFSATEMSDIVKGWKFEYGTYKQEWESDEIMHRNAPNLDPMDGLIFGTPIATSLSKPLSNIEIAYESRNVIMKNRGFRAAITSEKGDASGAVPLMPEEKEIVQQEMKDYGTREGQKQFFFSTMPLKVTPIDQDVMKLGLFEEIATGAMITCNAFGVPEILLKLYLQGATFENQQESERRLYQGTIIPESEDDMIALNSFFGLDDTEWELFGTFDHLAVLQKSEKEKAQAYKDTSVYMERLFLVGGITLNTWLDALDLKQVPNGNRTIFEMEESEREILLRVLVKTTISDGKKDGKKEGEAES